jgi:hypothetical protein
MKIQHIRRNNQLIGTLVAVKDEGTHEVKIGFSVVLKGDNPCKKFGVKIALDRAAKRKSNIVPKKIEHEFKEFVSHCAEVREFAGFTVPSPEDFDYSFEPIHQHGKSYSNFLQGWI